MKTLVERPLYFNRYGEERPWSEMVAKFGDIVWFPAPAEPGDLVWRAVALIERAPIGEADEARVAPWLAKHIITAVYVEQVDAAATIVVNHRSADGQPVAGLQAAWYWPDADPDPDCGPAGGVPAPMIPGRAVHGETNLNGDIGHAMGGGAYYWPEQGQIGPHAVWVYGTEVKSDVIFGLGMIAETDHEHLDVLYRQEQAGPGPEPPDPVPWDEIFAKLDAIEEHIEAIRALRQD